MSSRPKTLTNLGPRICIFGPSNSGKSTLASAIAKALTIPAIHLDQLRFLPGTNWKMRPDAEFLSLHDQAITAETWVIDGNYINCSRQRLERASSVILLETSVMTSLWRYFRRTWFEPDRVGALEGRGKDAVTWEMVWFIAVVAPKKHVQYVAMLEELEIPLVRLRSQRDMDLFYEEMGLSR